MDKDIALKFKKVGNSFFYDKPVVGKYGSNRMGSGFIPDDMKKGDLWSPCKNYTWLRGNLEKFDNSKSISFDPPKQRSEYIKWYQDYDSIYVIIDRETFADFAKFCAKQFGRLPNDFMLYTVALADQIGKSIESIEPLINLIVFNPDKKIDKNAVFDLSDQERAYLFKIAYGEVEKIMKEAQMSSSNRLGSPVRTTSDAERIIKTNPSPAKNTSQEEKKTVQKKTSSINIKEVKTKMKEKIKFQDKALDSIVNKIYINQTLLDSDNERLRNSKTNILCDGPTGTGKTFICREAAKNLDLPYVIATTNAHSTTGYTGPDLVDMLVNLLEQSDGDLKKAERGVVVLDEFDKIAYKDSDKGLTMMSGLQKELLTFIEGAKYQVKYQDQKYEFDTSGLTIVALGAFTDLREQKIFENENRKMPTGFAPASSLNDFKREYKIEEQDYIDFGLNRELVGRFSCITNTNELGVEELEQIMRESEDSGLKCIVDLAAMFGCELEIDDEVIHNIAERAFHSNIGARAIKRLCNSIIDIYENELLNGELDHIKIGPEIYDKLDKVNLRTYHERDDKDRGGR